MSTDSRHKTGTSSSLTSRTDLADVKPSLTVRLKKLRSQPTLTSQQQDKQHLTYTSTMPFDHLRRFRARQQPDSGPARPASAVPCQKPSPQVLPLFSFLHRVNPAVSCLHQLLAPLLKITSLQSPSEAARRQTARFQHHRQPRQASLGRVQTPLTNLCGTFTAAGHPDRTSLSATTTPLRLPRPGPSWLPSTNHRRPSRASNRSPEPRSIGTGTSRLPSTTTPLPRLPQSARHDLFVRFRGYRSPLPWSQRWRGTRTS
jgi:hypothetical protein